MPQPESSIRHAVEWLYEDEALRSNLTDVAAQALLTWAEAQIRRAALGDEATFREGVNRIRQLLATINDLVAARTGLSAAALRRRLNALPASRTLSVQALEIGRAQLASEGAAMRDDEFVSRLLPLLDPLDGIEPPPAAPSGEAPRRAWDGGRAQDERLSPASLPPPAPAPRRNGCLRALLLLGGGGLALLLLVAGLLWYLLSSREAHVPPPVTPAPTQAPPPVAGGWYEIYFTTPGVPNPNGPDVALARLLDSATKSIDVAIYQLDRPVVVDALLAAQARGVRVRLVTDIDTLLDAREGAAYSELEEAGIPMVGGNSSGIMHNKFVIVDGATVWTGSWNFTNNDTERHNNHGILLRSPALAANYTATFLKMWDDQAFGANRRPGGVQHQLTIGGARVENYFSPEDGVTAQIVEQISRAQRSIVFLAFSFTSDPIGEAVLARAASGVTVRGVFETVGSGTEYSEFGSMLQAGLDVRRDGNPYMMHHKVFILDERTVLLGSFNFSQNAERINDENLLIIEDPALAARFLQEFDAIYAQSSPTP